MNTLAPVVVGFSTIYIKVWDSLIRPGAARCTTWHVHWSPLDLLKLNSKIVSNQHATHMYITRLLLNFSSLPMCRATKLKRDFIAEIIIFCPIKETFMCALWLCDDGRLLKILITKVVLSEWRIVRISCDRAYYGVRSYLSYGRIL